jgi:hypothetical protein
MTHKGEAAPKTRRKSKMGPPARFRIRVFVRLFDACCMLLEAVRGGGGRDDAQLVLKVAALHPSHLFPEANAVISKTLIWS